MGKRFTLFTGQWADLPFEEVARLAAGWGYDGLEIAYDYWSTARALEAIDHRPAFGINWDPSHMVWQGLDPVAFITDFADRIYHVDCKDTRMRMGGGRNGILSSHLPWGDQHRGWDFVSTGRGQVPWEDAGMDRLRGAPEALEFVRQFDFELPSASFDSVFDQG